MKTFSSLAAVMGLWLAVSFLLWLCYRVFRRRDGSRQINLAENAIQLIAEGGAVFSGLRTRSSLHAGDNSESATMRPEDALREDVRTLLNAIEARSPYFDRVSAAKKKIETTFRLGDFEPLGELLQVRRDFWAASEIFLMDDIQALDPALADAGAYRDFQVEAMTLLFHEDSALARKPIEEDPVELRLEIAREQAGAFKAQVEQDIAAELEKSRFPSPAELIAVPWALVRGTIIGLRELRHLIADMTITAKTLARAMTSRGLRGAADELRRVRGGLPGQFATAFERAGGLARQGGQNLKRHYEFVIEAQELRARYAELLARAPILTEKGSQFLARLEIERHAERLRQSSDHFLDWIRQQIVIGIANLIAALQIVQAKVTPLEHKQLAPLHANPNGFATNGATHGRAVPPLRVLLPPAATRAGTNYSAGGNRADITRQARSGGETHAPADREKDVWPAANGRRSGRLRDLVMGTATELEDYGAVFQPAAREENNAASTRQAEREISSTATSKAPSVGAGSPYSNGCRCLTRMKAASLMAKRGTGLQSRVQARLVRFLRRKRK